MAISIIKLTSGETLITEVNAFNEEAGLFELNNPLQLQMSEDISIGKMNMFTSAWVPLFGDDTIIDIRDEHIIAMQIAPTEMVDYYADSMKEMRMKAEITNEMKAKVMSEILKVANTSIH